ncbi:unnamed protein product [Closterium sp. NIES-53]
MEVAHTSMIHAAAPHFLWLFAVRYSAHQLNLWPCVSLAETSPTLRWTGKVGKATLFRVWSLLARYVAPDRNRKLHWDVAKRVLRYLGSTSGMGLVFSSGVHLSSLVTQTLLGCEAEISAGAMPAQELRRLTYLLTDLGEKPRSPPHCGQLRLAYMATRANTADIFTKAFQSGDHQRFSTILGLVPTFPASLVHSFSSVFRILSALRDY